MEQELPIELTLGLEALATGDLKLWEEQLETVATAHPQLEKYAPKAIYFLMNFDSPTPDSNPQKAIATTIAITIAIQELCKLWELETTSPLLALKAYCFSGDEGGVERMLQKVAQQDIENNTSITGHPPLVDSILTNNKKITEALLEKKAWKGQSALRLSLSKAAKLGHINSLTSLLTKTPKKEIDPHMLRDALTQSILRSHYDCYKKICQFADAQWLETWKIQVESMHDRSVKDPFYPRFEKELKIITSEIAKKAVIKKLQTSTANNPPTLTI